VYRDVDFEKQLFSHLEFKDEILLENGDKYTGEWRVGTDIREGHGVYVWQDGATYEGYFVNNTNYGKGRIVHADGAYYAGQWINNMADGFGVYVHADGARYEGMWTGDK